MKSSYEKIIDDIKSLHIKMGVITIQLGDIEALLELVQRHKHIFDTYDSINTHKYKEACDLLAKIKEDLIVKDTEYNVNRMSLMVKNLESWKCV
jgi:hypothetical protein